MSADTFPELGALRVEIEPETRDQQIAEISRAARALGPVRPGLRIGYAWLRGAAATAAAAVLLVPAAAIAADDALPGDVLYPVKRLVEPVVQLFDRDVIAEHRVDELERLVDTRPDAARDLLAETRDAVEAEGDANLTHRLDVVLDSLFPGDDAPRVTESTLDDAAPEPGSDAPATADDHPADRATIVTDAPAPTDTRPVADTSTTTAPPETDRTATDEHDSPPADAPTDDGTTTVPTDRTTTTEGTDRAVDDPVDDGADAP